MKHWKSTLEQRKIKTIHQGWNRKPDNEMLKVHYGEELWFVKDRTRNSLLPRWGLWGSTTPAPRLYPQCRWPYIQSSQYTYCIALYECIAWCVGEGLRAPILQSLPSLSFLNTNHWKPDSALSPHPDFLKYQPLKAWQWNVESPLWRRIVIHQKSKP